MPEQEQQGIINRLRNGFETKAGKLGIAATIALGALTLSACSETANATSNKPTHSASAEATPTTKPTPKETSTPEATSGAHEKFQGTIDYATFDTNWASLSEADQQIACAAFYEANPPDTTVVPSDSSTGPEVVEWFNAHMTPIYTINNDTSDTRNHQVALNLLECMTSTKGVDPNGLTQLQTLLNADFQGGYDVPASKQGQLDPTQVTQYSNGFFGAPDGSGAFYNAMTVEGENSVTGGSMVEQFDWQSSGSFTGFKLAIIGDGSTSFGPNSPIVVSQ